MRNDMQAWNPPVVVMWLTESAPQHQMTTNIVPSLLDKRPLLLPLIKTATRPINRIPPRSNDDDSSISVVHSSAAQLSFFKHASVYGLMQWIVQVVCVCVCHLYPIIKSSMANIAAKDPYKQWFAVGSASPFGCHKHSFHALPTCLHPSWPVREFPV